MEDKDVILKVENISKQYRLGVAGTGTISHDLNRFWYKIRGKEDPYLKIGETNDRSTKGESDYVWAIKDISFDLKRGEVLGIIGENGAGKSTLLKILSRLTGPTTGSIKTKGRIASLLEVGTGFHPEMTGRENIYLNGAILGMTKKEIDVKIDEIIEFSGCIRYVDTAVKRYSSGMKVRLAFAVAAFLEPDILVVDEVLAVGDAEFQKKAIGKMQDISSEGGRTVLFVSHNMESIQALCTRLVVLSKSKVDYDGDVTKGISYYLSHNTESFNHKFPIKTKNSFLNNFKILNNLGEKTSGFLLGNSLMFSISYTNNSTSLKKINIRYQVFDENEVLITTINTFHQNKVIDFLGGEEKEIVCQIDKINLSPAKYLLGIQIIDMIDKDVLYSNNNFSCFEIINGDYYNSGKLPSANNLGKVLLNFKWSVNK